MMMHNQFDSVRFNDYAHNNQEQQFAERWHEGRGCGSCPKLIGKFEKALRVNMILFKNSQL